MLLGKRNLILLAMMAAQVLAGFQSGRAIYLDTDAHHDHHAHFWDSEPHHHHGHASAASFHEHNSDPTSPGHADLMAVGDDPRCPARHIHVRDDVLRSAHPRLRDLLAALISTATLHAPCPSAAPHEAELANLSSLRVALGGGGPGPPQALLSIRSVRISV